MKLLFLVALSIPLLAQEVVPSIPLEIQRDVALAALDLALAQQTAQLAQEKAEKACGSNHQPQRQGTEFVCVAKPEPKKKENK